MASDRPQPHASLPVKHSAPILCLRHYGSHLCGTASCNSVVIFPIVGRNPCLNPRVMHATQLSLPLAGSTHTTEPPNHHCYSDLDFLIIYQLDMGLHTRMRGTAWEMRPFFVGGKATRACPTSGANWAVPLDGPLPYSTNLFPQNGPNIMESSDEWICKGVKSWSRMTISYGVPRIRFNAKKKVETAVID